MSSPQQLLAAAKQAATSGHKEQARELLGRVLQLEPDNEDALILLASVAPDLAAMKRSLEQALLINPANPRAVAGMEWVRKQELARLRASMAPGAGSQEPAYVAEATAQATQAITDPTIVAPQHSSPATPGDPVASGSRLPALDALPRARRGTGPLDNSPQARPGLNEVPQYPNGA